MESYADSLQKVCRLKPEHISAYSLIIEEGTPFAECELDLPDEDTEYQMYEDTAGILAEYGYQQYEISNYAKDGYFVLLISIIRSEEHTYELQSRFGSSYAVFCLKKKKKS